MPSKEKTKCFNERKKKKKTVEVSQPFDRLNGTNTIAAIAQLIEFLCACLHKCKKPRWTINRATHKEKKSNTEIYMVWQYYLYPWERNSTFHNRSHMVRRLHGRESSHLFYSQYRTSVYNHSFLGPQESTGIITKIPMTLNLPTQ